MKLTVNTDPSKSPYDNPGVEVGLDSIQAWLTQKQISPTFMSSGEKNFGLTMTDGTRLDFLWDRQGGRVTVTPPGKRT